MLITYDNGVKDQVTLKLAIREGEESRSIRKIEFWFDTKGRFSGKAIVIVYG